MKKYFDYNLFDWVLVNGEPFQVCSLTRKKVGIHTRQDRICYLRRNEIEPMLVTEEFLIKNDFKLKDDYQGYKQYYNYNDSVGLSFSGVNYYTVVNNKVRYINYVHELQLMYKWHEVTRDWII